MSRRIKQILLLVTLASASVYANESQVKTESAAVPLNAQAGPEPRQISSNVQSSGISSGSASNFPYNLYQNAILSAALPQTASSSGSWLSILRPSQGGRRASLTSRLRNVVSSIFRRDQSPYLAQGSSLSYSLRPPPNSGLFGGFGSGLTSGLGSGFSSGSMGSALGSQQNLFASASGYQPIMMPSGSSGLSGLTSSQLGQLSAAAGKWSSYKGVGEDMSEAVALPSAYNAGQNYGWTSTSGNSQYPQYAQSYASSGTGSSGAYQSVVSSPSNYQVAASSYNPTSTSYTSSSYPSGSSQYQRSSSSSSFKPIVSSSSSYSSGLVGSSSLSSPTYSTSSVSKPVQAASSSVSSNASGSYSAQ